MVRQLCPVQQVDDLPQTPGLSLVGGQLAPARQLCSETDIPFQPMADRRSPPGRHSGHPWLGHISEAICVSVCVQRGLVRKPQLFSCCSRPSAFIKRTEVLQVCDLQLHNLELVPKSRSKKKNTPKNVPQTILKFQGGYLKILKIILI